MHILCGTRCYGTPTRQERTTSHNGPFDDLPADDALRRPGKVPQAGAEVGADLLEHLDESLGLELGEGREISEPHQLHRANGQAAQLEHELQAGNSGTYFLRGQSLRALLPDRQRCQRM